MTGLDAPTVARIERAIATVRHENLRRSAAPVLIAWALILVFAVGLHLAKAAA